MASLRSAIASLKDFRLRRLSSSASLEASIKERVKRLLNADVTDIPQADDLDTVLGIEAESSVVDKEDEEEPYGQGESARDNEEEREWAGSPLKK